MKECQICKNCFPDEVTVCPNDQAQTFHSISGEPMLEGKYKLEKRLGQGGMGVVYCSRHSYLKTQHAIKVILPDLVGNDPQLVTRFRQEALAAAAIRHHNVIAVTDFGVAMGTMPFLVMEFVEGESLHDMLVREHRLAPEKAVELMSAICAGVGAAHRQGIVHRDLKPLNVMIQKDKPSLMESVKILDFGLAKIKSGELLGSFIQAQTTGLMGSPYYMAPEQWADEEPDAQADIYSLGVMLFQMLAGDVPFKGSSIPAIMKKHLSDPPPSFAELGVQVPPMLEAAVRRTLEKDRSRRTQTVEQMVEELRSALGQTSPQIHQTSSTPLPVSTVHVLTDPPQSKVFVDSVAVGESRPDGSLLLEGIQSGNHLLRVSKEGFQDWENNIFCEGKPQQIVAHLQSATGAISRPQNTLGFNPQIAPNTPPNLNETQPSANYLYQTNPAPQYQTGNQSAAVAAPPKKFLSPLMLAIIGIGVAFMTGLIRGGEVAREERNTNQGIIAQPPTNANSQPPPPVMAKNEMALITGGKFLMGRSDGKDAEQPAHEVEVKDFYMDKTEVTNAEYHQFVRETGYKPPAHWVGGAPVPGEEMFPVVRVAHDDVKAFAAWRSKRDGAQYRLPTEQEWEYAARNGGDNNLYPWGDKYEDGRAVVGGAKVRPVGSTPNGANKWGVYDLVGNVWEWTGSELAAYPGSSYAVKKGGTIDYVIRGGSYASETKGEKAVFSSTRLWVEGARQDIYLGFRLVRPA